MVEYLHSIPKNTGSDSPNNFFSGPYEFKTERWSWWHTVMTLEVEAGGSQEISANLTSIMRPFLTKDLGRWLVG